MKKKIQKIIPVWVCENCNHETSFMHGDAFRFIHTKPKCIKCNHDIESC